MRASLFLLVLGFILSTSCKSIKCDPCDTVICGEFQPCTDGSCPCAADSWDMGTFCFPRNVVTTGYKNVPDKRTGFAPYYSTSTCQCLDTMVIYLDTVRRTSSGKIFPLYYYARNKRLLVDQFTSGGPQYYPKPDGDSIYIVGFFDPIYIGTHKIDGKIVKPIIKGKFNVKKDTLQLKILWATDIFNSIPTVVDSCTKVFTR
jgi:hypothetical protein